MFTYIVLSCDELPESIRNQVIDVRNTLCEYDFLCGMVMEVTEEQAPVSNIIHIRMDVNCMTWNGKPLEVSIHPDMEVCKYKFDEEYEFICIYDLIYCMNHVK